MTEQKRLFLIKADKLNDAISIHTSTSIIFLINLKLLINQGFDWHNQLVEHHYLKTFKHFQQVAGAGCGGPLRG